MTDSSLPSASQPGSAPRLQPSQIIARLRGRPRGDERYSDPREIGRGAMGQVNRVFDGDLRRHLAMKVMLGEPVEHDSGDDGSGVRRRARFLEEAQVTGQLDHPGIVPVHELGLDSAGRLYFTMRLVKGRDLRGVFDSARSETDGWNLPRAVGVLLRVCEAVAYAHSKGVIHRDLKPANVMVGRFGEVYVMDWGLARVLGREGEIATPADASLSLVRTERHDQATSSDSALGTMDGDIVGTPSYMAPEQARGRLDDLGPRVDVYSLGAMLYELLSGSSPYVAPGERVSASAVLAKLFKGPPAELAKVARGAPEELVAICEKAMARDLRERYPDMLSLAEDLRAFLEGRVVRAHRTGAVVEFRKWIGRNRAFAATVAAALAVALGLSSTLAVQQSRANAELQVERDAARRSAEEAQSARDRTEEANARLAEEQRAAQLSAEEALRKGYLANIAAADAALRGLDIVRARQRLDECGPEARANWEWRYLDAACSPRTRTTNVLAGLDPSVQRLSVELGALVTDEAGTLLVAATGRALRSEEEFDIARAFSLPALEPLSVFDTAGQRINDIALSRDGNLLAIACADRSVRLFEARTQRQLGSWPQRDGIGFGLAFDPTGATLALGTLRKGVRLVDPLTGAERLSLENLGAAVSSLAFDPQGLLLAVGLFDGRALVVDALTGNVERELGEKGAPVIDVEFSPDGFHLSVACGRVLERQRWSNTVREWSASTGALSGVHESQTGVAWCGYSATGDLQLAARADGSVWVGDRTVFEGYDVVSGTTAVSAAARAGRDLVLADAAGDLRLVSLDRAGAVDLQGTRQGLVQLALLADPPRVVALDRASSLRLWDGRTGELVGVVAQASQGHSIHDMTVDATSGRIVATHLQVSGKVVSTVLHVYSSVDGEPLAEFAVDATPRQGTLALSGDTLALGLAGGSIELRELPTGERRASVEGLGGELTELVVLSGGRRVLARLDERAVVLWDSESGRLDRVALPEGCRVRAIQACEDGAGAWLDLDAELVRLDLGTLQLAAPLPAPRGERGPVHWLAGERRFACVLGTGARSLGVFEPGSEVALLQIGGGEGLGDLMATSPDGLALACGTSSGTVRMWTAEHAAVRERARAEWRAWEVEGARVVERLVERELLSTEAAIRALREDRSLNEPARSAALRLLRRAGGSAAVLRSRCRSAVLLPLSGRIDCQVALWQALELGRLETGTRLEDTLFLEGAARYRLSQFGAALECFDRAATVEARRPAPELLAFRAMALARLGRVDEARALLPEIPALARDAQLVPLVWEASSVLRAARR